MACQVVPTCLALAVWLSVEGCEKKECLSRSPPCPICIQARQPPLPSRRDPRACDDRRRPPPARPARQGPVVPMRSSSRRSMFWSQRFKLPRLVLQCRTGRGQMCQGARRCRLVNSLCAGKEQKRLVHSVRRRLSASLWRETTNKWCAGPARFRNTRRLNCHMCGNASDRSPAIDNGLAVMNAHIRTAQSLSLCLPRSYLMSCLVVTDI